MTTSDFSGTTLGEIEFVRVEECDEKEFLVNCGCCMHGGIDNVELCEGAQTS